MTTKRTKTRLATIAASLLGAALLISPTARAHCDTLDGPVVTAAKVALAGGDITPVLMWVKPEAESEIKLAFARALAVRARIPVAGHPTHVSRRGDLLAIVAEDANEVVFLDAAAGTEVARVGGLMTPHFVRWAGDSAYVANLGAHHVSRIDLGSGFPKHQRLAS